MKLTREDGKFQEAIKLADIRAKKKEVTLYIIMYINILTYNNNICKCMDMTICTLYIHINEVSPIYVAVSIIRRSSLLS
jgi:predicted transport protein